MALARPGRPRKNPVVRHGNGTYEEIADAAAELFSKQGFTATSMNQIATAVGVAQNSIYHHFGSKLALLQTLLLEGVRPGLQIAEALAREIPDTEDGAATGLYALALADGTFLVNWRWNIGALVLLPEARGPELAEFRQHRQELRRNYIELSRRVTSQMDSEDVGDQVLRLVVSIINQRWDDQVTIETPSQLARSGLRICGHPGPFAEIDSAARQLLSGLEVPDQAIRDQLAAFASTTS